MASPNGGGLLVRRSIVFIPKPPDLPTFTATTLDETTLLIFAKLELENPIRCWRIHVADGRTISSQPLTLTGAADRVNPGFQATRLGPSVVLLGGYTDSTRCTAHLDVFVCKQRGAASLHIERVTCSGPRIPTPRTRMAILGWGAHTLLVFGGCAIVSSAGGPTRFRDTNSLYTLDLKARRWRLLAGQCIHGVCDRDEDAPGPRAGCLVVADSQQAWVLGGHRIGTEEGEAIDLRSQVFVLQPEHGVWQRVHTAGRTPDPRDLHNAAALLWDGHIYVIGPRQCHRLDLRTTPPTWALLPGTVSTRGAVPLANAWLQHHTSQHCTAHCAVRAPGPEPGEPHPPDDPGGLDWQLYAAQLAAPVGDCTGSVLYTPQQQPAADVLLAARARAEASYAEWQDMQQRQARMKLQRSVSRGAHAEEEEDPQAALRARLPYKVVSFGDHRGSLVWELPDAYVAWMAEQPGFFEERRALLFSLAQLGKLHGFVGRDGRRVDTDELHSMASLGRAMDAA